MKVLLQNNGESAEAEFDPEKVRWKSKNYGWFSPEGVYFPEVDKTLFVKHIPAWESSLDFLDSHMHSPCSEQIPALYGLHEDEGVDQKRSCYLFFEKLEGVTLDNLRGRIDLSHCREILAGVLRALKEISDRGYWYTDLDFGNIFLGQGQSGFSVRLIDIDSCIPVSTSFTEYVEDRNRRLNVNEKYWSYLTYTMDGKGLDKLAGKALTQAAFMYFTVDLFFNIKYPNRVFSLKPADIIRLMQYENKKYFPLRAKQLWHLIHSELRANPASGIRWTNLDRFATAAFQLPYGLYQSGRRSPLGDGILNSIASAIGRIFR